MDESVLRDVERWKDKIEVRLDNRQVFFLFFGSAMVACMLFVLGVIVGKRLESRGRALAPVVEDPLAALDRFGVEGVAPPAPSALTFPRALQGGGSASAAKPERVEHAERAVAKPTLTNVAPVAVAPSASASTAVTALAPPSGISARKLSSLPHPLGPSTPSGTTPGASKIATAMATPKSPKPAVIAPAAKTTTAAPAAKSPGVVAAAKPAPANVARSGKPKGAFLLQLSSFQDRTEAEAFARRFAPQNAYVVPTEVPGKGSVYRVRVGSYSNLKEATLAKTTFEHDHGVIAYVSGSGPAE